MNIAAYPRSADSYTGLAEALLKMGDAEGAIANFAEALRLDPGNKPARDGMEKAKKRRPS
jgi:cytochrome c-type biogenesis protein CcmH/NrfG